MLTSADQHDKPKLPNLTGCDLLDAGQYIGNLWTGGGLYQSKLNMSLQICLIARLGVATMEHHSCPGENKIKQISNLY